MKEELADIEIIYKPSEDNISTNNPKAEPSCEKKITNVYIAKQKILFVVIEAGDFLGKIAKSYEALTADDIADINKLPKPNELAIGQEIVISSKVHIVQEGDSLGKIAKMSEYAPVEWEEIAKANQLSNPNNIFVGQKLVIPLARSKHAKLCKEIKYVSKVNTSVGDVVHIVTEVTGFKNGESVKNTIKEDKNIVTQAEENLTVVKNDKEKKEIISIIKLDEKDPTKGEAVSEPLEVKPKLDMLIYTVKEGDVLGKIVKLYTDVTEEDIVTKNELRDKNSIYVGQKLIIPTDNMKDITTTQEVKDKLNKEPSKSTEMIPTASSPSLPKDDDVEGETVNLTVEPKIVDVYFGTPVKSSKVKPTTQVETYTFRSTSTTITKDNQKKIITKYIIPRTTKGDKKATYTDALKALPLGTYKKGSTIKVTLSEPVYTYKKIKSTSLFSTVYLVAEVKDFPADEKVRLEILEQDGVLASKGANVKFIDKTKVEVTSVEATVSIEGKKQYAVAKVTLSRTDEKAKKSWKEKIEKAKDKKSHLKVKGTSVSGLCDAKKSLKKVELVGVSVLIKFIVDKGIALEGRPYEIILEDKTKILGEVEEENEIRGQALPDGKHKFKFTLPSGYDKPKRNTTQRILKDLKIKDETRDIVIIRNTLNLITITYTTYTFEPPKTNFNINLTGSGNKYMKSILGSPSTQYGSKCDNTKLKKSYRQKVVLENVGPFRVTGLEKAVESLKEVFLDLKDNYPTLHDGLTSAGMLCSRYVGGSRTSISNHSWGTAIDLKINGQLDPYNDAKVQEGLLIVAKSFNKFSWFWGIHFSKEDGMHFEVSNEKLKEWYPKSSKIKKVITNVKK